MTVFDAIIMQKTKLFMSVHVCSKFDCDDDPKELSIDRSSFIMPFLKKHCHSAMMNLWQAFIENALHCVSASIHACAKERKPAPRQQVFIILSGVRITIAFSRS